MAIGALPALSDGNEARCLTSSGHAPSTKINPQGPKPPAFISARATTSGESLARWDCDADVEVVHDDAGHLQDMALADPRILLRLG